jgi:hypothetical protein
MRTYRTFRDFVVYTGISDECFVFVVYNYLLLLFIVTNEGTSLPRVTSLILLGKSWAQETFNRRFVSVHRDE